MSTHSIGGGGEVQDTTRIQEVIITITDPHEKKKNRVLEEVEKYQEVLGTLIIDLLGQRE
ncbi:hypothetical protein [Chlamydia pecorum]|uniref:hypothetical protein n=1 Tax=Chlamydia pecorum TaxID=85991 RepID=UPI0005AA6EF3|nr:hypothetical protein [Chlamydia pecorum]UJT77218.1 hypothetical protein NSWBovSBE_0831 [Chlamydia pecorum]